MTTPTVSEVPETLLSTRAMAEYLGVSERWLRAAAQADEVPHYVLRGVRRFDPREMIRLMRREAQPETPEAA